jgi:hypothetical protein
VIAVPPATTPLDVDMPDGHFFKQANGFGGAGAVGFAVVDDVDGAFWSEFQRLGGVERLGYPVSNRFTYQGFVTQAFQKFVLQWRPENAQAVAVNVFDELTQRGSDGWLASTRQVPAPAAVDPLEGDAAAEDILASHLLLLAPYQALLDFYTADSAAMDTYGLPLAVRAYSSAVVVRLQRASLQLSAADGTVTVSNGGDMAKDAGLLPATATSPMALPVQ